MITVYTIGHSNHPIETFIDLLKAYHIQELVDVRSIPKSRHNPQFNLDLLADVLNKNKIGYVHIKELGGFHRPVADSINTGWEHPSFKGYADYMQTPEFEKGMHKLMELVSQKTVAIMCAEAVPWQCHRRLIADALLARNCKVIDILGLDQSKPHIMTAWAHIEGTKVTYPGPVNARQKR